MKKLSKDTTRSIISVILSFLMTICITLLVLLISMMITTFQTNSIAKKMDTEYFETTQNSLTESLKELAPPSGLPDSIFDNLFSLSMIEQDTKEQVQDIVAGINYEFDSAKVKQLLMDRFSEYARNNGTDIKSTNLESLADSCVSRYEKQVSVLPFLQVYAPIRLTFDKIFTFSLIGLSGLLIVLTLFLFSIHRYKHRAVRYSIYSLFASALMIIPIPLFCLIQGSFRNIAIEPKQVQTLLVSMIQTSLWGFVLGGIIIGLLGVLLLLLVTHMRDSLITSGHSHHY